MSARSSSYQNLIVGKGEQIVDEKIHWKDFIQVHIDDPKVAFKLAMDILRQVENQMLMERQGPVTFSLTGSLEPDDE